MIFNIGFVITNIMLGIGLSMDAFSVSLANGLNEPCMKKRKMFCIAGMFAFFQALMPMLGWICIHTIVEHFRVFEKMIPWIALILLSIIGGKMLIEGIKNKNCNQCDSPGIGLFGLIVQGIATSIDALSVGFTIANHDLISALTASIIIASVTLAICLCGVIIGKKAGTTLSGKAGILGGIILIVIGIEIFVSGYFNF